MLWRNIIALSVVTTFLIVLWQYDISSDGKYRLEILEPIVLLKEPPHFYPTTNEEVGRLLPNDPVKVTRMAYGKDFRAWRVVGPSNQSGWFVESGENVIVHRD